MTINMGSTLSGTPAMLRRNALTTHAAVVGMTGSGKTGLLLGIVEELSSNKVPIVLVDIKGDMCNIALRQDTKNVVYRCVTPGGTHGEPVNVFADLANKDKVSLATSTLLRLAGENPDPLQSKAHAYISTILQKRHAAGKPCELIDIIRAVQEPGFHHLGAMDLDYAFPKRSRIALAGKLNNLLVAPSFQPWREGVTMNMDKLLADSKGRTPVVVYSVAHLVDQDEQTFALGLLFDEMLKWTRSQSGSEDLRACMIVDECVGLLPPHPNNPPTKTPLLLMLKQARAFGVGCILATQNPVDLDYKAMSNCGTWLIGRLSMDRDRARVIKGVCSNASVTQDAMEDKLGGLQSREFVVVRPKGTVTIKTRTVGCDLRGPMSPEEITDLYGSGLLEYSNPTAVLRQRLHLARKQLHLESTPENIARVAQLEQRLKVFGDGPQLRLVSGGA